MKINEIYRSIQGESSYSGLPCVFVRLTYCNLRCSYCDTTHAFYEGTDYSIQEILAEVKRYQIPLVEVTGGEPLLQDEVHPLMDKLIEQSYTVLLETSGSVDIGRVNPEVIKIMDLKCPGSGESDRNLYSNLDKLQPHDEIKFVIGSREDYEWTRDHIEEHQLAKRYQLLISTVFQRISPQDVVQWMLQDNLPARFQLQLHKYIWEPTRRRI